jgi:hypothetical protein
MLFCHKTGDWSEFEMRINTQNGSDTGGITEVVISTVSIERFQVLY